MESLTSLIIFFLVASVRCSVITRNFAATGSDFTLNPGAFGEEVTWGCIQRLESLGVFSNDFGLMNRVAKAESNFGTNYTTTDTSRDIWQIPSSALSQLSAATTHTSLIVPIAAIRTRFGDSFVDFNNFDLTIPLHSAIAARLFIELLLNTGDVPSSLDAQATWWATYYNPGGDSTQFVTTIINYEATKACPSKPIDLWILLDGSSSIGAEHFNSALNFINDLSRKFVISPSTLRVGLSVYSYENDIDLISTLDGEANNHAFESAVNSTVYQRGRTYTGAAIDDVIYNGFSETSGARPHVEGIPRVLILLTDGFSSDNVAIPAARAHFSGITILSVGVGLGVQAAELEAIANYPPTSYVYTVPEYEDLTTTVGERLAMQLCNIPAGLPHGILTSLIVPPGTTHHSYILIPVSGQVTIALSGSGSGIVYFSTLPNPTFYLHLAAIQIIQGIPVTLTVTAQPPTTLAKEGISQTLVLTGHDSSANEIPLYLSTSSQGTSDFRMDVTPTHTATVTTTSTTTTTAATATSEMSTPLETWVVLVIAICACLFFLVIVSIVIITIGVWRSSKKVNWSDNVLFSLCCCVISSAAY